MKKLFITLCILLMATTCQAAQWVDVTDGEFGAMGIDADSILHYTTELGPVTSGKYGWQSADGTKGITRKIYIIDKTLEYVIEKEWEYKDRQLIKTTMPKIVFRFMGKGTDGEKVIKAMVNWNTGAEPKQ